MVGLPFHRDARTDLYEFLQTHPGDAAVFDAAMTAVATQILAALLTGYDFTGVDSVVDVGGGSGGLLAAIMTEHPGIRGTWFDQPSVLAGAVPVLAAAGVVDRCQMVGGDFFVSVPTQEATSTYSATSSTTGTTSRPSASCAPWELLRVRMRGCCSSSRCCPTGSSPPWRSSWTWRCLLSPPVDGSGTRLSTGHCSTRPGSPSGRAWRHAWASAQATSKRLAPADRTRAHRPHPTPAARNSAAVPAARMTTPAKPTRSRKATAATANPAARASSTSV